MRPSPELPVLALRAASNADVADHPDHVALVDVLRHRVAASASIAGATSIEGRHALSCGGSIVATRAGATLVVHVRAALRLGGPPLVLRVGVPDPTTRVGTRPPLARDARGLLGGVLLAASRGIAGALAPRRDHDALYALLLRRSAAIGTLVSAADGRPVTDVFARPPCIWDDAARITVQSTNGWYATIDLPEDGIPRLPLRLLAVGATTTTDGGLSLDLSETTGVGWSPSDDPVAQLRETAAAQRTLPDAPPIVVPDDAWELAF